MIDWICIKHFVHDSWLRSSVPTNFDQDCQAVPSGSMSCEGNIRKTYIRRSRNFCHFSYSSTGIRSIEQILRKESVYLFLWANQSNSRDPQLLLKTSISTYRDCCGFSLFVGKLPKDTISISCWNSGLFRFIPVYFTAASLAAQNVSWNRVSQSIMVASAWSSAAQLQPYRDSCCVKNINFKLLAMRRDIIWSNTGAFSLCS